MKIECFADEKQILVNGMLNDGTGFCPLSCGGEYCSHGNEGCKECLEKRIEWAILEENE